MGNLSNNLVEPEALIEGLALCLNLGIKKFVIEGDSEIILNTSRKKKTPNWVLSSKLEYALGKVTKKLML